VHRDVKPSNFLLKSGSGNPLALIDFGLARLFIDPESGDPFPERARVGFRGTPKYASLSAQRFRDQCPRDDLISWLYSVIELVDGSLPWGGESDSVIGQRKKAATPDEVLFRSLPKQFLEIASYIGALKYTSVVNYDHIVCLVGQAIDSVAGAKNEPFDWEQMSEDEIAEFAAVRSLPVAASYVNCFPRAELPVLEEETEDPELCACAVA
jgi:serine/threonine protein kinase